MAGPRLVPLDHAEVAPLAISARLRSQLVYFARPGGGAGVPELQPGELYFDPAEITTWLDEGVISLVSPLDTDNTTDVELSEDQESLLEWLKQHGVRHVRVED